jgi:hypothetical protein
MPRSTQVIPKDISEEIRKHVAVAIKRDFPVCADQTAAEFLRANPHCKLTNRELVEGIARTVIAAGGVVEFRRNLSLRSSRA